MASQADNPVKRTRQNRKLTQGQLGVKAHISTSYISMIEHGLVPPHDVQIRLAGALGRPIDKLFPGVAA